jgi:hypothetical protein
MMIDLVFLVVRWFASVQLLICNESLRRRGRWFLRYAFKFQAALTDGEH